VRQVPLIAMLAPIATPSTLPEGGISFGVFRRTFGVIQGTFGVVQGTFGVIQETFSVIQETFSVIPWNNPCDSGFLINPGI
jgi:hypothetical protein